MKTKKTRILFVLLSIFLLAFFSSAAVYWDGNNNYISTAIPPQVNTEGLCYPIIVTAAAEELETDEIEYEMYFEESDVIALAQMLYGEARGCSTDNQIKAVWCVLNRVDDTRFPNTVIGVLSAPYQFHGYSSSYPVWDNLKEVARDVLTRWSLEKQGVCVNRELPKTYLWFTGNGVENVFREAY
jgi:hypothetical protein